MLYCDKIDASEGIDVNKTSESENICHYWHFLNKGFKFQSYVSNKCSDLVTIYMNLSNVAILDIKGTGCRCIIIKISKIEAINLLLNIDLTEKMEHYKTKKIIITYEEG